MAQLKKVEHPATYEALRHVALAHNEKGDCAVKALSLLTGVPYGQMRRALKEAGRKPRCGTQFDAMHIALAGLGFKLEKIEKWTQRMIASYPGIHKNLHNVTTHHPRRFKKAWDGVEPLLLDCSRHVAAFKDGVVHDWTVNRSMRIKNAYRIVRRPVVAAEDIAEIAATIEAVAAEGSELLERNYDEGTNQ